MNIKKLFKKAEKPAEKKTGCSVVVVAAGSGQRMGADKLMLELGCMPVLARTLLVFENCALIDEIIVVTRMDKVEETAALCKKFGITKAVKVIRGGKTRMESALAGVSEVNSRASLIAIHDGARPLVTEDVISRAVDAAAKYMSAVPVIRSTDTLKAVDDTGVVIAPVDREHTVRVQTPQVFNADLIKGALSKAVSDGLTLTDDCSAVEIMGVKTHTVDGDEDNIKLTTPRDVLLAELILKNRGDYSEDRTRL